MRWAGDLDSWDLCDQLCQNLVRHTPFAWTKALEWSARPEPFVKRMARGFPITLGLAAAFLIMFVSVPVMRFATDGMSRNRNRK